MLILHTFIIWHRAAVSLSILPTLKSSLPRYVAQVISDSQPGAGTEQRPFYDFLESCLRHKAEMVIFEAARAICNLKDVTARELAPVSCQLA